MKTTPTSQDWKKYTRWKYRYDKEGIKLPREGDIVASLDRMEREHPELTSIPDKALEMKRTEKQILEKKGEVPEEKVEEEAALEEEEVPEEEEEPQLKFPRERKPHKTKVHTQTQERDITVVLRLKLRVEVEVEE